MKTIIKNSVKDIKEKLGENLVSLYLVGTSLTSDKAGDVDFFVIIKKVNFDEDDLNKWLTKKYKFPVKIRCILYDELLGKKKKATLIMKLGIFTVPVLVKILKLSKLVAGKKLKFDKFPIKELDAKKYLKFELNKLKRNLKILERNKKPTFPREDFPKFVAYLVRAELFLKTGKFFMGYEDMARQLKNQPEHIIHDCIAIRNKKKKLNRDFLDKVKLYIKSI